VKNLKIVKAARTRKYKYLAISDHSQSMGVAHGLREEKLRKQMGADGRQVELKR
jgi:histidinol phosphatase-like PHP family hydrolase